MDENKILNTIKQNGIKPIPKRHFLIKKYLVISLGVIVTILGATIFAKIVASILVTGWEYWDYVFESFYSFVYFAMPVAWIILLIIFTFLTPFIFEKTTHGYRYKKIILVMFSILISIILGLVILKVGAHTGLNKFFVQPAQKREAMIWVNPSQGRLAGYIGVRGNDSIILEDYSGKFWAIDVSNLLPASKKIYENNDQIRIIGVEIDDNTFIACQIMPFDITENLNFEDEEIPLPNKLKNRTNIANDVCSAILRTDL